MNVETPKIEWLGMAQRETTVTEDLKSALEQLEAMQTNQSYSHTVNNVVAPIDVGPAITAIESALSKIQNLRCEATAQLEKL